MKTNERPKYFCHPLREFDYTRSNTLTGGKVETRLASHLETVATKPYDFFDYCGSSSR